MFHKYIPESAEILLASAHVEFEICENKARFMGESAIEAVRMGLPGFSYSDARSAAHFANFAITEMERAQSFVSHLGITLDWI